MQSVPRPCSSSPFLLHPPHPPHPSSLILLSPPLHSPPRRPPVFCLILLLLLFFPIRFFLLIILSYRLPSAYFFILSPCPYPILLLSPLLLIIQFLCHFLFYPIPPSFSLLLPISFLSYSLSFSLSHFSSFSPFLKRGMDLVEDQTM